MRDGMADLERRNKELLGWASPMLDRLIGIARDLKLTKCAEEIAIVKRHQERDRFTVAILGRFRNGKSTMMNALLGRLTYPCGGLAKGGAPLPTSVNETTARTTRLYHNDTVEVFAVRFKNFDTDPFSEEVVLESWTIEKYLKESVVRPNPKETERIFRDIMEFRMGYPCDFLRSGVEMFDTAGMDSNPRMDRIAKRDALTADAAILLLRHSATLSDAERNYVQELMDAGLKRFFVLINTFDPVDDRTYESVWYRLNNLFFEGRDPRQSVPILKQLADEDVYFVNALKAENGKLSGDDAAVENSGLKAFERRLAHYLETEKRFEHLKGFKERAEAKINTIQEAISKEIPGLKMEKAVFDRKFKEIEPQIAVIQKRREAIVKIIHRTREQAQITALGSLTELYHQINAELPAYMAGEKMKSFANPGFLNRLAGSLKLMNPFSDEKSRLGEECMEIARGFLEKRVGEWQKNPPEKPGIQKRLKPVFAGMVDEIKSEAVNLKKDFARINFELTGWKPPATQVESAQAGFLNRITAAAFCAMIGKVDGIAMGYSYGWGAVLGDFVRILAIAVPLAFIVPATFVPIVGPIIAIAAFVWQAVASADKLEQGIKDTVLRVLMQGHKGDAAKGIAPFAGLVNEPLRMKDQIYAAVDTVFANVETAVMKEVDSEMEMEIGTLRKTQQQQSHGAESKQARIQALELFNAETGRMRADLENLVNVAAQSRS